ncbi:hypothetical protein [Pseudalkalibacillus caeni]|uniref:Uncharacterized protein n=1 Tax=Exobacillus caeni TaxID=2574798 RepID=A0A5R9F6E8_9BACL|nr:hypothetical protein [Pseudalkalibacillus caeni]TLS35365.1 hypothetical protein FCL54_20995 [Pseudalkalibacillus caeni]
MMEKAKEQMRLLFSILGQQMEQQSYDDESFRKLSEISKLLEENVEISEENRMLFDSITHYGEDALDIRDLDRRKQFINGHRDELEDFYSRLRKQLET